MVKDVPSVTFSRIFAVFLIMVSAVWTGLAIVCWLNLHDPRLYLIDIFTLPILSACLVWTLVMALARQKSAGFLSAAALAGLVMAYAPQVFTNQPKPSNTGHSPIRILFNNLYVENRTPEAIRSAIAAEAPDIVVLVEVRLQEGRDPLKGLETAYPYREVYYDRVILSRFPISGATYSKHLSVTRLLIKTPDGPMDLVAVHLTRPWPFKRGNQSDQIQRLTDFLSSFRRDHTL